MTVQVLTGDARAVLAMPPAGALTGIVNVSQVPQRSPFRYPGGKTWAIPTVRRWLAHLPTPPAMLLEPFAGGAIVSLTAAFEGLVNHVTMSERDDDVAAVWTTIITGDAEWLARRIAAFNLTPETVAATLARAPETTQEHAFQTILRNRVQRGGIMARGAGVMAYGENGKGLRSRWYADTLAGRICAIARVRERITFIHGDGMALMRAYAHRADCALFIDPPYTAGGKRAGSRLYAHSEIDHEELFRTVAAVRGDCLMTYDNAPELHELARRSGLETALVPMKTTHHVEMTELLIGRDLGWVGTPAAPPRQGEFR